MLFAVIKGYSSVCCTLSHRDLTVVKSQKSLSQVFKANIIPRLFRFLRRDSLGTRYFTACDIHTRSEEKRYIITRTESTLFNCHLRYTFSTLMKLACG